MAKHSTRLNRMGTNTLRFIGRQQTNAITTRNKGVPVLAPKIKLQTSKLKKKKTLRSTGHSRGAVA